MQTARASVRANTGGVAAPTATLPNQDLLQQAVARGRPFHLSVARVFLPSLSASFEETFPGLASPSLFFLRVR